MSDTNSTVCWNCNGQKVVDGRPCAVCNGKGEFGGGSEMPTEREDFNYGVPGGGPAPLD